MTEINHPMPEQPNPLPDTVEVVNGIAGIRGSKGKFYPITTDMGVEIIGDMHDPVAELTLESTIPNGVGATAILGELPQPPHGSSHVDKADFLAQLDASKSLIDLLKIVREDI